MAFISIPTSIGGVNIPGKMGRMASGPLSVLFNSRGLSTHKYPLDLGTDSTKLHYVQFSISEVIPASFTEEGYAGGGTTITLPGAQTALTKISEALGSIALKPLSTSVIPGVAYAGEASSTTLGISNETINSLATTGAEFLKSAKGPLDTMTGFLSKGLSITPRMKKPQAVISLYMPDTIDAQYNAEYDEMSLTGALPLLTTIRQIDQLASTVLKGDISSPTGVAETLVSAISTDPNVISLAGKFTNNEDLGALMNKGRGYALNPQLQMIYKGLDLRNFQLTFTFTPKSAQESREVDSIISLFKYHYAPRLQTGTSTVGSMYLIPPSMFNVQFMHDGKENTHLPKYGDCVLVNIDVNYTPNGFAAYEDGSPVQSMIMLQFKEVEAIDRGKLESGILR